MQKIALAFLCIFAMQCGASNALADYRDLGPFYRLTHRSVDSDCSYRLRKKLFSRTYFFNVASVVFKAPGDEIISWSPDPFVELRAPITRTDLGFLNGDVLNPEHAAPMPNRFFDPELRIFLGHKSELNKVYLDFSVPNADPTYDLTRSIVLDPVIFRLEEQCVDNNRTKRRSSR